MTFVHDGPEDAEDAAVAPLVVNPPITIGELADVPAPGSYVASNWAQEVSNRVIHRFATVAAMNAWSAANGSMAYVTATTAYYQRWSGTWVIMAPPQTEYFGAINNGAAFTIGTTPPYAAPSGLSISFVSRPYARAIYLTCQMGVVHSTGGTPTYYVGAWDFTGFTSPGDLQFYGAKAPTGTFGSAVVGIVGANAAASVTLRLGADVAETVTLNSNTYLQALVAPGGFATPLT